MKKHGFTLIELLVVMAIIAVLISLAVPRYFASVEKSREAVLRQDLALMRDAIQKYYSDKGKYPDKLEELESARYLRKIPVDPITDSATTWIPVPAPDPAQSGVYDIKSGAEGKGIDGSPYGDW